MKKLLTLLLLTFAALGATAQNTAIIHGAVIDKNGNAIPGAEVKATGGAESTISADDGSFSLEVSKWLKSVTAKYPGMRDKKLKTDFNNEMLFTMKPGENSAWFVGGAVNVLFPDRGGIRSNGILSVKGGYIGDWGCYLKLGVPLTDYDHYEAGIQVTIGIIKRFYQSIFGYFGLGYGGQARDAYNFDYILGQNYIIGGKYRPGGTVEFGAMYKKNRLVFGLGLNMVIYQGVGIGPELSAGYCF